MFDQLCDDAHDAHTMKVIHRTIMVIGVTFLTFGSYAVSTRFGAEVPPSSISYGTEKAPETTAVFGD